MKNNIFVLGHKSPDLDSVAGAIAYASYKNKVENSKRFVPLIAGNANLETKYLLKKLNISLPEISENLDGKQLILVDHNEELQTAVGCETAEIIEVLDHHKVVFSGKTPIEFCIKPWGASCTIIADKYFRNNIDVSTEIATLMLGAILVDTIITKSPTCTAKDFEIIEKLSQIAGINDWKDFGMELFKIRSNVSELTDMEIIKSDFKDFKLKAGKFGIGQVETVSLTDFKGREEAILKDLQKLRNEEGYHSVILFLTDIVNIGSLFLISSEDMIGIEKTLGGNIVDNKIYIKGVVSRKKQVAPKFNKIFDK